MKERIYQETAQTAPFPELPAKLQTLVPQSDAVFVEGEHHERNKLLYPTILVAAPHRVPVISVYSARPNNEHQVWQNNLVSGLAEHSDHHENLLGVIPASFIVCYPGRTFAGTGEWRFMLPARVVHEVSSDVPVSKDVSGPSIGQLIRDCNSGCALIFAAKDEASRRLTEELKDTMTRRGSSVRELYFRDSYIGVMQDGIFRHEQMGPERLQYEAEINGRQILVKSAGNEVGNAATIRVDGNEYAHSRRGLSVVLLKGASPPRAFSYDTHGQFCP